MLIADSSALPEQLVSDALQSAFNSAGQEHPDAAMQMWMSGMQAALQQWIAQVQNNMDVATPDLPGISGTYGIAGWGGRKSDGTDGWSARGAFSQTIPAGNPLARREAQIPRWTNRFAKAALDAFVGDLVGGGQRFEILYMSLGVVV